MNKPYFINWLTWSIYKNNYIYLNLCFGVYFVWGWVAWIYGMRECQTHECRKISMIFCTSVDTDDSKIFRTSIKDRWLSWFSTHLLIRMTPLLFCTFNFVEWHTEDTEELLGAESRVLGAYKSSNYQLQIHTYSWFWRWRNYM